MSINPSVKKNLLRLFPVAFYGLLVAFLVIYLQRLDWSRLEGIEIAWQYVAVATGLALVLRYWGAYIWFVLLKSLGASGLRAQTFQLLYVYAKSWLGRYIPGTAPWIIGKIYFASRLGVSKNKLAVSSLLEGALQIVVTLAIAFAILIFDSRLDVIDTIFKLIMAAVLLGCVVAMIPWVFNRIIAVAYRIFKRKAFPTEHMASSSTILKGAGLYVIGALVGGLSFFFIAKAAYVPLAYTDLLFVLGVSNLANATSMLAVFAPSGIGVREGIQVLLLSLIMPVEFALLIAVVTRLWSVTVDFLFFGMARATKGRVTAT
jgi:glycosyltransferase 2 family protein